MAPPATVETNRISTIHPLKWYPSWAAITKAPPTRSDALRVRRRSLGPASKWRRLTIPSTPLGASAYPRLARAVTRVKTAYCAVGRNRARIRFAAANPTPEAPYTPIVRRVGECHNRLTIPQLALNSIMLSKEPSFRSAASGYPVARRPTAWQGSGSWGKSEDRADVAESSAEMAARAPLGEACRASSEA